MTAPRLMGTLAFLFSLFAVPAAAQHAQTREGFWFGGGLGVGSLGCSECSGDRTNGGTAYIKLGGTLNPHLLLGVESNGWYKSESGVSLTQGILAGAAYWYPSVTSGFFAKGGLGYARLHGESGFGDATTEGFGVIAGLGYDIRVGGNTSITPVANWFRGSFDGGSSDVLQLGLGVTLH